MIDDIERRWSRELGADVEIEQHVWIEGVDFSVLIDGHSAYDATSLPDAERFLETLSMVTEREVDGY